MMVVVVAGPDLTFVFAWGHQTFEVAVVVAAWPSSVAAVVAVSFACAVLLSCYVRSYNLQSQHNHLHLYFLHDYLHHQVLNKMNKHSIVINTNQMK